MDVRVGVYDSPFLGASRVLWASGAILRTALSEALYPGYSDATAQLGGESASGPARGPLLLWLRPRRTPRDGGQPDA